MVLPRPLRPTRIRFNAEPIKSSVRARSITSRSILAGQDQSKSAMGLKLLMPLMRRRRSKLRRERSAASAFTNCSRIWRVDQRDLVARAMKSSSCAGTAHRPICWSWEGRLLLVVVVVFVASEFIVGLQIMRADVERLGLRMAAEIDGGQWGARLAAKQEGDGRSAGRVALERFGDGAAERGGSILIQQLHQVRSLMPGRFPLRERLIQKRFAFGHGLLQPASGRGVERFALALEDRLLMRWIEHGLVSVITADMTSDLDRAIQNAHAGRGSQQRQLPADRFRRNGIVVEIEAHIDGLTGTHRLDAIGGERVQSGRQQTRLLFGEHIGHGAVVASGPAALMRHLIAPQ